MGPEALLTASFAAGPPPSRPPGSTRRRIITAIAAGVVVVAAVTTLVFTLSGAHTVSGQAIAAIDARTIASTFIRLENERYNAGTTTSTPAPSAVAYAGVSCQRDLAEMRGNGASPPPLNPPHRIYSFGEPSITPTSGGRQLLRVARTTLPSGPVDTAVFALARESGRWTVCGLFADTRATDPTSGGGGQNGGQGSGSSSGSQGSTAPVLPASDIQSFLSSFSRAVNSGDAGTAAEKICVDDPAADAPIESWTAAHALITTHVNGTGNAGGSASLHVTVPDKAQANYVALVEQSHGGLCIEALLQ